MPNLYKVLIALQDHYQTDPSSSYYHGHGPKTTPFVELEHDKNLI